MSASLVDDLMRQLQGAPTGQIAQQLGTDPNTAASAIEAALPMLLGALGRNTQQPGGAADLFGALQRDHGGGGAGAMDLGGLLGGLLGGGAGNAGAMGGLGGLGGLLGSVLGGGAPASRQMDAGGILGHIFGGQQGAAQAGVAQASGLQSGQAGQLLQVLAPIVMAHLGNHAATSGGADALSSLLGQEHTAIRQQGGAAGGLLGSMLDQDGDGQLGLGDLLKAGEGFLGGGGR